MLRLIWLFVIPAVLWCGWWALASSGLRTGTELWLEDRRAEGWQADASAISVKGFPTALTLTLDNPALADPDTGVAFSTDSLQLETPAWWPGHVTTTLPGGSFEVASPTLRHQIAIENGDAKLRLRPGAALELEHAGVTSGAWQVKAPAGTLWGASSLEVTAQQSSEIAEQYQFVANAPTLAPGQLIRRTLRIPADWPVAFDSLTAEGVVTFDRPIDRRAIEEKRPQPRAIDLKLAEAVWGELSLRTSANLVVSEQGLATGDISFQARNWQEILKLAEVAGVLPAALIPQFENVLGTLARGGGNPDALDLAVKVQDGAIFLGFIPLGQLPPLALR